MNNLIAMVTKGVDPATLPPPRRPWNMVVQGNRDTSNGWKLKFVQPEKDRVRITKAEQEEVKAVWENALVGYILDGKPRFSEMVN